MSHGNLNFTRTNFSFGGPNYGAPGSSHALVAGDFNADGKADLALVGGGGIDVWISDGTGAFARSSQSWPGLDWGTPPTSAYAVIANDINGDGRADFVFVSGTGVDVWMNNGNLTFSRIVYAFNGPNYGNPPFTNFSV